ncbi:MAG: pilin [bacterium]|nr:pilin [bacterium]
MNTIIKIFLVAALLFVPTVAIAQTPTQTLPPITQEREQGITQERAPAPVPQKNCETMLCNPLKGVDSIGGLIFKVINFVYSLSYAVIAVFLIISGFKFVVAQGSEDKITDAKNTFKYTIIGAILLIGANVITEVIKNLIDSFR